MLKHTAMIFATTMALGLTAIASADTIDIAGDMSSSTEQLGSYTGSVCYDYDTVGTLVVSLTNTSAVDNGGYLTALLFQIGGTDAGASAALTTPASSYPFETITGGNLAGSPFGDYDAGAGLGADFTGGGSTTDGIAVGETGVFTFAVTADDASTLSAIDFVLGGDGIFDFLVRFRGFEDGGSDKVPASVVPLPMPLVLGLAGLGGIIAVRRRRA